MINSVFNTLMNRVYKGDISAMEPIYEEYYNKLQIVAVRILKNMTAAEDAASQTIIDLISDARNGKIKKVTYVSGYLYTRCKNVALKIKKRNSIFQSIDSLEDSEMSVFIDKIVENADLTHSIINLSGNEKEIGFMFYIYGYKIREISEELNMPEGTVKWHIRKIKQKILKNFS